ncbi:MAG: hypothetical protein DWI25_03485 [Planctomycetota bacterium]|nr:MAG: hypothetical protein DWI25_03485 [Planctomycetota bacterium]
MNEKRSIYSLAEHCQQFSFLAVTAKASNIGCDLVTGPLGGWAGSEKIDTPSHKKVTTNLREVFTR